MLAGFTTLVRLAFASPLLDIVESRGKEGGRDSFAPADGCAHHQRRRVRTISAGVSAVQRRRFRRGPKSQIDLNLCAVLLCLWRRG